MRWCDDEPTSVEPQASTKRWSGATLAAPLYPCDGRSGRSGSRVAAWVGMQRARVTFSLARRARARWPSVQRVGVGGMRGLYQERTSKIPRHPSPQSPMRPYPRSVSCTPTRPEWMPISPPMQRRHTTIGIVLCTPSLILRGAGSAVVWCLGDRPPRPGARTARVAHTRRGCGPRRPGSIAARRSTRASTARRMGNMAWAGFVSIASARRGPRGRHKTRTVQRGLIRCCQNLSAGTPFTRWIVCAPAGGADAPSGDGPTIGRVCAHTPAPALLVRNVRSANDGTGRGAQGHVGGMYGTMPYISQPTPP